MCLQRNAKLPVYQWETCGQSLGRWSGRSDLRRRYRTLHSALLPLTGTLSEKSTGDDLQNIKYLAYLTYKQKLIAHFKLQRRHKLDSLADCIMMMNWSRDMDPFRSRWRNRSLAVNRRERNQSIHRRFQSSALKRLHSSCLKPSTII